MSSGFNTERWFAPFVNRWLDHISTKTVEWVDSSIKADSFKPEQENVLHSTSVTDLFCAIAQELDSIKHLEWSNPRQTAQFMLKFSKTMNLAIEQYCDALEDYETKHTTTGGSGADGKLASNAAMAANLIRGWQQQTGPRDIQEDTCVRVSNIETALKKLDEIYRDMDVQKLNVQLKSRNSEQPQTSISGEVHGNFNVEIYRGERLRPASKNGLSSSYVVVRVPAAAFDTAAINSLGTEKKIAAAAALELMKSRVGYDSLSPVWDESFQVLIPAARELEVVVYNKNLLFADEVIGRGRIQLSAKLMDHQTHDVWVTLEPQGRVLFRITMEGEEEDIVFYFRKTYAKLLRTRHDFRRVFVSRVRNLFASFLLLMSDSSL